MYACSLLEILTERNLLTLSVDRVLDGEFTRLGDPDRLFRLVARTFRDVFDRGDDVHALEDFAKHDVATVEPRGGHLERDNTVSVSEVAEQVGEEGFGSRW